MDVPGRDGKTHRLDDRNPPHVYRDGEDNGVATQTEEALWTEVVSLREQQTGAVPVSGNHALLIGQVAGLLAVEFPVEFIDDAEGRHLDTVRVTRPSGTYLVTVRPEES
jgi:hypothetical protein